VTLPSALRAAVEAALEQRDGRPASVAADHAASGGCIHDSRLLELADGRRVFLKSDASAPPDLFEREAEGLAALAAAGALRVPRNPLPGRAGDVPFLLMEAIPTGSAGATFWDDFGHRFAELHRTTAGRGTDAHGRSGLSGFPHDNYLGGTLQLNGWTASWVDFFRDFRLAHQLRLARERGIATDELLRLGDRLLDRLDDLLDADDEPACLLHGDLWSGNYLADDSGSPVLIDPAAYYGHREADLAMTTLFGGFAPRFYAAYEETWPLPPGTERRQDLYQLYHLLNHLNLFGGSYLGGCLRILRRYT
jgi:fructosamine-3-kinase